MGYRWNRPRTRRKSRGGALTKRLFRSASPASLLTRSRNLLQLLYSIASEQARKGESSARMCIRPAASYQSQIQELSRPRQHGRPAPHQSCLCVYRVNLCILTSLTTSRQSRLQSRGLVPFPRICRLSTWSEITQNNTAEGYVHRGITCNLCKQSTWNDPPPICTT